MNITTNERPVDRLYVDKSWQYTHDPAFDGSVIGYLRIMVEEYTHQARSLITNEARMMAAAKRDAYVDAVRVLADADDAAYRFATEATR